MRSEYFTDYQTIAKIDNLETITYHSKQTKLNFYVTTLFINNSRLYGMVGCYAAHPKTHG